MSEETLESTQTVALDSFPLTDYPGTMLPSAGTTRRLQESIIDTNFKNGKVLVNRADEKFLSFRLFRDVSQLRNFVANNWTILWIVY